MLDFKKRFLINVAFIAVIALLVFGVIRYVIPVLMPFIVGFLIAMALRPAVRFITNKFKLKHRYSAILVVVLFYGTVGLAITLLTLRMVDILQALFSSLPTFFSTNVLPVIDFLADNLRQLLANWDIHLEGDNQLSQTLTSLVNNLSSTSVSFLTNMASSVPFMLVSFIFTIISSFFFALDYSLITRFIYHQMSPAVRDIVQRCKRILFSTLGSYLKAYFIIMSVTFLELCIGLGILRVDNFIWTALLIAMVDILPVFGTGFVVLPWALIELFMGHFVLGVGLVIVYGIITVIRNFLEPKVVGDQIGLYPLVTLVAMYAGSMSFGIAGLFGVPICLVILIRLQEEGIIKLYKPLSKKQISFESEKTMVQQ